MSVTGPKGVLSWRAPVRPALEHAYGLARFGRPGRPPATPSVGGALSLPNVVAYERHGVGAPLV